MTKKNKPNRGKTIYYYICLLSGLFSNRQFEIYNNVSLETSFILERSRFSENFRLSKNERHSQLYLNFVGKYKVKPAQLFCLNFKLDEMQ